MSNYWKSKVLPKFKKFFDKSKKKGAAEVCKSFDTSKESLDKEIIEKSEDLNPKVVEIYRSSSTFITKKLLKEPNEATVKGNPAAVQGVLEELVKVDFPGAKGICDAGTKFGPALLPGPVVYLFEKASVYLVEEPLPEEPKVETREVSVEDTKAEAAETPAPPATETETPAAAPTEPEAVPKEEVKEEEPAKPAEEPAATLPPASVTEAAAAAETPAPAVVEKLAVSGVTVPADDPPAAAAAREESAAPPPPVSAPPPAAEKTD